MRRTPCVWLLSLAASLAVHGSSDAQASPSPLPPRPDLTFILLLNATPSPVLVFDLGFRTPTFIPYGDAANMLASGGMPPPNPPGSTTIGVINSATGQLLQGISRPLQNQSETVAVGLDIFGNVTPFVFANDRSALAFDAMDRVRLRHVADRGPLSGQVVDAAGAVVATFSGLANGQEQILRIPRGTYTLEAGSAPGAVEFSAPLGTRNGLEHLVHFMGDAGGQNDRVHQYRLERVTGRRFSVSTVPVGCGSAQADFRLATTTTFQTRLEFDLVGPAAPPLAVLQVGVQPLALDLTSLGFPGCTLGAAPVVTLPAPSGSFALDVDARGSFLLPSLSIWQFLYLDPTSVGGVSASDVALLTAF